MAWVSGVEYAVLALIVVCNEHGNESHASGGVAVQDGRCGQIILDLLIFSRHTCTPSNLQHIKKYFKFLVFSLTGTGPKHMAIALRDKGQMPWPRLNAKDQSLRIHTCNYASQQRYT